DAPDDRRVVGHDRIPPDTLRIAPVAEGDRPARNEPAPRFFAPPPARAFFDLRAFELCDGTEHLLAELALGRVVGDVLDVFEPQTSAANLVGHEEEVDERAREARRPTSAPAMPSVARSSPAPSPSSPFGSLLAHREPSSPAAHRASPDTTRAVEAPLPPPKLQAEKPTRFT